MTGAMYAGISGMKAHMNKLNVIGNNIANVNTYGYKTARTTFEEAIYTTLTAGSNGTDLVGGTNPSQIGYGCNIGTIDLDMSNGPAVPTGVNMDCLIQGDGFFLVGDKSGVGTDNLDSLKLSRVGNFHFDPEGYLVDGKGNVVYGFLKCSGELNPDGSIAANTPPGTKPGDYSSHLVPIRLPLAASKSDPDATPPYEVGDPIYPGTDGNGHNTEVGIPPELTDGKRISANSDSISIDSSGKITITTEGDKKVELGYIGLGKVDNPAGLTHLNGPYYQALDGAGHLSITTADGAMANRNLDNKATDDATGVRIIGSNNSLLSGFLEGSGTDLATEFSEMITTQRGYQANTRIITVTDTMLEELVNMKR